MKSGSDLYQILLDLVRMPKVTEKEIMQRICEEFVDLTGSRAGYFHLYDEDKRTVYLTAWSGDVMNSCRVEGNEGHYPLDHAGIWADCIRLGEPVIHNDYRNEPDSKGYPEGHVEINNHMSVPVFEGDRIVAVAGVGNRSLPYHEGDTKLLELVAGTAYRVVRQRKDEWLVLRERDRYRELIDRLHDSVFLIGIEDLRILHANLAAVELLGYARDELTAGMTLEDIRDGTTTEKDPILDDIWRQGFALFQSTLITKDGSAIPVEVTSRLTEWDGVEVYLSVVRDNSERYRTQKLLNEKVDLLISFLDSSKCFLRHQNAAVVVQDTCRIAVDRLGADTAWIGVITEEGPEFRIAGSYGRHEDYVRSIRVTWDDSPSGGGPAGKAIRLREPFVVNDLRQDPGFAPWRRLAEVQGFRSAGAFPLMEDRTALGTLNLYSQKEGWFTDERIQIFEILANQAAVAMERSRLVEEMEHHKVDLEKQINEKTRQIRKRNRQLTREIREHRITSRELQEKGANLRALASELNITEEKARRKIAQVLHDEVGQNLSMIKVDLMQIKKHNQIKSLHSVISRAIRTLDESIASTRSLTFELSPPVLYELGLKEALEWLTEDLQEKNGMAIDFRCNIDDIELDDDMNILLYQAARELMVNVIKHAEADLALLSIQKNSGNLVLEVKDDGRGFTGQDLDKGFRSDGGFGIFSIRERVGLLGGSIKVRSMPGSTTATVTIPCEEADMKGA